MTNAVQKWLNFLREPGRQKTTSLLEDFENPNARCCLGHACAVLGTAKRTLLKDKKLVCYDGDEEVLPNVVARELGITHAGDLNYRGVRLLEDRGLGDITKLTEVNDDTDLSPSQIADLIEELYEAGAFVPYGE